MKCEKCNDTGYFSNCFDQDFPCDCKKVKKKKGKKKYCITRKDFEEILTRMEYGDIFTAKDYDEDYSIPICLTVKEIREIAGVLK